MGNYSIFAHLIIIVEGTFGLLILFSASCHASYAAGISPLYFSSRSTYRVAIGALAGGLLCIVLHFGLSVQAAFLFSFVISAAVVLICVFNFAHPLNDMEYDLNHGTALESEEDIDIDTNDSLITTEPSEPEEYGHWKQKCYKVASLYGLTSRETEIFVMLTKGRNTRFIANDLFISPNTVKTHTYRIYKKLDVQTRQELIDLVESVESR